MPSFLLRKSSRKSAEQLMRGWGSSSRPVEHGSPMFPCGNYLGNLGSKVKGVEGWEAEGGQRARQWPDGHVAFLSGGRLGWCVESLQSGRQKRWCGCVWMPRLTLDETKEPQGLNAFEGARKSEFPGCRCRGADQSDRSDGRMAMASGLP